MRIYNIAVLMALIQIYNTIRTTYIRLHSNCMDSFCINGGKKANPLIKLFVLTINENDRNDVAQKDRKC